MLVALFKYLMAAAVVWTTVPGHKQQDQSHFEGFLQVTLAVCTDPNESPIFKGDDNRLKTCTYLVAQAFEESHLWRHVYEGHCSKATGGDCDANNAWGAWQIHDNPDVTAAHGIDTDDSARGWHYTLGHGGKIGGDLVKDPRFSARLALHMLRTTPGAWTTNASAKGRAMRWVAAHPFVAVDSEPKEPATP
jgi:hypothetical protein